MVTGPGCQKTLTCYCVGIWPGHGPIWWRRGRGLGGPQHGSTAQKMKSGFNFVIFFTEKTHLPALQIWALDLYLTLEMEPDNFSKISSDQHNGLIRCVSSTHSSVGVQTLWMSLLPHRGRRFLSKCDTTDRTTRRHIPENRSSNMCFPFTHIFQGQSVPVINN